MAQPLPIAGKNMKVNLAGLSKSEYHGNPSTLCQGCGHNSISNQIIAACYESNVVPEEVVKFSGIGCSSKSPTYFMNRSFGFNSLHGRMPSIATGTLFADKTLRGIGVSGDGDSASSGMGQFKHAVRRNLPMVYIVENNGVYGLTKGQDSATTDVGSKSKKGEPNALEPINLCAIALQLGATFVANSFSGDKKQLVPIIKAAIAHEGFAFINVISPCVTFNNVVSSTKSYDYIRQHMASTNSVDYVPPATEITTDYEAGTTERVSMHDGSLINLHKLDPNLDIHSRRSALEMIYEYSAQEKVLTGILFIDPDADEIHKTMNTTETPLRNLTEKELCPGTSALEEINDVHR